MRSWRSAILAIVFLVFLTSLPQVYMCIERGSRWNGGAAFRDPDEFGYAAYVQALIDGFPRLIDPYTGLTAPENLYSIQFIPAYVLALPARLFGLSASSMFAVIAPIVTILSSLLIFWLLFEVSGNGKVAAIGILGVLTLSTALVASIPVIGPLVPRGLGYFPYLRSYVPSVMFPLLFMVPLCIWKALTKDLRWAIGAGLGFAILVFCYFYLWTATLAWFAAILILWAIFENRGRALKVTGIISPFLLAIGAFAWLSSQMATHMADDLAYRFTRKPDLTETSEILGLIILSFLLIKKRRGPAITFAASFALVPLLIFNQQIITGRSLQPFHYTSVVANYWIVLAAFILLGVWRAMPQRMPRILTLGCIFMGLLLSFKATHFSLDGSARIDQGIAVKRKLKELGPGRVHAPDPIITNSVVSVDNPMLWAQQSYTFSNITNKEQSRRYFVRLCLMSVTRDEISQLMERDFITRYEVFGNRANMLITAGDFPITREDEERGKAEINEFCNSLNLSDDLNYAVLSPSDRLENLNHWYSLKELARVEDLTIYRLERLK